MSPRKLLSRTLLPIFLVFTLSPALHAMKATEQNLIKNGNFEQGTNGWQLTNGGKGGTMAMDQTELHDGKPTLRIESPGELTFAGQSVKVKAHTTYLLTGYIKVKGVHENGGGRTGGAIVMMWQSQYGSRTARGTADWQTITTQLNTDDKTEIRVGPALGWWGCNVIGTAWFSGLSLTELEGQKPQNQNAQGENLIVNGNFERGDYGWELINFEKGGLLEMDPTTLHNGKPTLRVDSLGEMTFARQVVAVKAHTTYRLSGFIKVKDVHDVRGNGGIVGANLIVGSTQIRTKAIPGTSDWQEVSVEFDTQDKTAIRVEPAVGFYAQKVSGTGWFSEMTLTEIGASIAAH